MFEELDNVASIKYIEEWITKYNVQLIGGCCGLGPDYITGVSAFVRRHNASVRDRYPEKQVCCDAAERAAKRPRLTEIAL